MCSLVTTSPTLLARDFAGGGPVADVGMPACVVAVGGSDSSGGAGIQADLKAITAHGAYGLTVVTAVTAQDSRGVHASFPVPGEGVEAQLRAVVEDFHPRIVKTGMLGTADAVRAVVRVVAEYRLALV